MLLPATLRLLPSCSRIVDPSNPAPVRVYLSSKTQSCGGRHGCYSSRNSVKGSPQLLNQLSSSLLDSVLATEPAPVVQAGQPAASLWTSANLATALQALSAGQVAPAAPQFRAVIIDSAPTEIATDTLATGVAHDIVPGEAIHQVIGPVDTVLGKPVFIIFHPVIEALSVFTSAGISPVMLLTIDIPPVAIQAPKSFTLPASTIWIQSRLLAPLAPADGYIGLTISAGNMNVTQAPAISGKKLTLPPSATVSVHLELAQPVSAPDAASQFGADARALNLVLRPRSTSNSRPQARLHSLPSSMRWATPVSIYSARQSRPPSRRVLLRSTTRRPNCS